MSFDNRVTIAVALRGARETSIANWLLARKHNPELTGFWAEQIEKINDAQAAFSDWRNLNPPSTDEIVASMAASLQGGN